MKKCISLILTFGMMISICVPASAAYVQTDESDGSCIIFDMEEIVKTGEQEFSFVGDDGETTRVGVRFTPRAVPFTTELGSYDVTDGEWDIYYYSAIFNVTYNVMVTNKKITDAYNLWYLFVGPSLSSSSLTYTSTKATAYFTFQTPIWDLVSWNGYLNTEISNGKLKVIVI